MVEVCMQDGAVGTQCSIRGPIKRQLIRSFAWRVISWSGPSFSERNS